MMSLVYLHTKGVFYGDMKPQNILIFKNQSVKLGDFGMSLEIDSINGNHLIGHTSGYVPE